MHVRYLTRDLQSGDGGKKQLHFNVKKNPTDMQLTMKELY